MPEFGIERLYLVSKGRRVSVASFLGPDEKASFAKALMAALQAARRGPTYNPVLMKADRKSGGSGAAPRPTSGP